MSEFSLIKKMSEEPTKPLLPEGVAYKRFTVTVDKIDTIVHIPLRESEAFESAISETNKITTRTLRTLLREFRGIREPVED